MLKNEHTDGGKECSGCKTWRLLADFNANVSRWDGLRNQCKHCEKQRWKRTYQVCRERILQYSQEYNRKNKKKRKDTLMRSKFGIGLDGYHALLDSQDGVCAICGQRGSQRGDEYLAIDHCHSTHRIRGLLCAKCNMALGGFSDSVDTLKSAVRYLERAAQ